MKTAYEWENKINKNSVNNKINWLRKEIKRISTTTLRGNFTNIEDRNYWVKRLAKLNCELSALETM